MEVRQRPDYDTQSTNPTLRAGRVALKTKRYKQKMTYKGTKVKSVKNGTAISVQPKYLVNWPTTAEFNVRNLLAGILAAPKPKSVKETFIPKVEDALYNGDKLSLGSVDLEALGMGDPKYPHDKVLLVGGFQKLTIENHKVYFGQVKQPIVDLPKVNSIDVAAKVHNLAAECDALLAHFARYDVGVLRSYEPKIIAKYGSFKPLPNVVIDLMSPMKAYDISASQAHIITHFDLGAQKSSVNLETWQDVVKGEFDGMTHAEQKAAVLEIRDTRNKGCLASNIAELAFTSRQMPYVNKFSLKETYPNLYAMSKILGSSMSVEDAKPGQKQGKK